MADNNRAINRVFTRGVLRDLLQNSQNDVFNYVVSRYINDPKNKTHGEIFRELYDHLGKEQRNEYYYMNTLLNRLLCGIHSVNTTTALSHMQIGNHIADFVMINDEGRVYEIKSDLDNFDRLYCQLSDYFKAFSKVSVLSTLHELEKVSRLLENLGAIGEAVGIYFMNDCDSYFNRINRREPKEFNKHLDHINIFKLLRKREYENVLMGYYHTIPRVAPAFHFRACLEQFQQIPILTAHGLAFKELKKRNKITKIAFENIQLELKSIIYFSDLSRNLPDIEQLLQTTYRE